MKNISKMEGEGKNSEGVLKMLFNSCNKNICLAEKKFPNNYNFDLTWNNLNNICNLQKNLLLDWDANGYRSPEAKFLHSMSKKSG